MATPPLEITDSFDDPYSEATDSLPPSYSAAVVGLNGRAYLIDNQSGEYTRFGIDVVQQRNVGDARDILLLPQGIWRQSVNSWHQGAGQTNMDRDDALQYRYENSYGINPWNRWEISLLNETAQMYQPTGTHSTFMTTVGGYLAVIRDNSIYWFNNFSGTPYSTTSTISSTGSYVIDIADAGLEVTTLHSDGKVYTTSGPGVTPASSKTISGANFIAYEKDYLICGHANKLYDITQSYSAGSPIYTHPVSSFSWISAAEGANCIYVLGGNGDRWVVHRVGIKTDGTALQNCVVAATLPDGEIGYSISSYLGYVFIGTNRGVRMAVADNNGDLTLGAIIPTESPVRCFEGQDRFVWYGNSTISQVYTPVSGDSHAEYFPTDTVSGLGRMDLTTFTTTSLTPAYANDLVAADIPEGTVRSVLTFSDKRVFLVDNKVYYETDNKMPGGWLSQGIMSFSVEDLKAALYMQGKWYPLTGFIDFDLSYDSSGYSRFARFTVQDTIRSDNVALSGVKFSRVQSRYVLIRDQGDNLLGPRMTRWELRSSPVKGRASRWKIPVMNYEEIELDGVNITRDPLNEYNKLMDLVQSGSVFIYQESGQAYQVVARDFEWRPEKVSSNGKSWQGVFVIVIEEVQ